MKELVVISGKGGTGKTSLVASFAALSENSIFVDCDVDAADLHLVLSPSIKHRENFSGGKCAQIDTEKCIQCGECVAVCRFDAIVEKDGTYTVDEVACEGCNVCTIPCPTGAIDLHDSLNGEWFISDTDFGQLVHARLGIAEENSGKLVATVRHAAKEIAEKENLDLILVDGPPGIGCPVIASITGSDLLLVVTEPTMSGFHDCERVLDLATHFNIQATICINKWDINPEITSQIEEKAKSLGAEVLGRVRYDKNITLAQIEGKSVIEYGGKAAEDISRVWKALGSMGIRNEQGM